MSDDYKFVKVHHGSRLPKGAVKALHRGLNNTDARCVDSYVALCKYEDEICFGRSYVGNCGVHGSFPWGDYERKTPNDVKSFKILVEKGSDTHKYPGSKYKWRHLSQVLHKEGKYNPVVVEEIVPCVVSDVHDSDGQYLGEMLGKVKLGFQYAWVSYGGKELVHTGEQFWNSYLLCRKKPEFKSKPKVQKPQPLREMNIFIIGLDVKEDTPADEVRRWVHDLFAYLNVDKKHIESISIRETKTAGPKVIVELDSKDAKLTIMKVKSRKLKHHPKYHKIFINNDWTVTEAETAYQLRQDLKKSMAEGNTQTFIDYTQLKLKQKPDGFFVLQKGV